MNLRTGGKNAFPPGEGDLERKSVTFIFRSRLNDWKKYF
jgi:hypothetical protein